MNITANVIQAFGDNALSRGCILDYKATGLVLNSPDCTANSQRKLEMLLAVENVSLRSKSLTCEAANL